MHTHGWRRKKRGNAITPHTPVPDSSLSALLPLAWVIRFPPTLLLFSLLCLNFSVYGEDMDYISQLRSMRQAEAKLYEKEYATPDDQRRIN